MSDEFSNRTYPWRFADGNGKQLLSLLATPDTADDRAQSMADERGEVIEYAVRGNHVTAYAYPRKR